MSEKLFEEFDSVSAKQWKQKIQYDLKGADYNAALIWKSQEGIDVKPFYHADDFEAPLAATNTSATEWKIAQAFEVHIASEANIAAREAIERGSESIIFYVSSEALDFEALLQNIDLTTITAHIFCNFVPKINKIESVTIKSIQSNANNRLFLHCDIIGNLAKSGNWYVNLKEDHLNFETFVKDTNQLSIDLSVYQNAGATMSQQLAYGLAHINEYLNHFDSTLDHKIKEALKVCFKVSVGSNYFFEIAKLRALRQLWHTLSAEYGYNHDCHIITMPSKRNKTIYDYNTNMLRTTTECMSAILGGANTICNLPYDAIYHHPNEFGDRISRNQLLVLKHEGYFDLVDNPADGSYYIENLTDDLAQKAMDIFKSIEGSGGFLKQLKEGTIQRKIKESADNEQADFDTGKIVLLGTNKHPNPNDRMKSELEKSPFLEKRKRKTLIKPIIEYRLSEKLEINRLKKE